MLPTTVFEITIYQLETLRLIKCLQFFDKWVVKCQQFLFYMTAMPTFR